MEYYFSKITDLNHQEAIEKVTEELKKEGFGILTEIDVKATFKKKLDIDYPEFKILGACNPNFAHKALGEEIHIGTMLPCNVVVRAMPDGKTEVFAVDPQSSMSAVENESLGQIAGEVRDRLKSVIETI